jgi:hypothetical protein
MRYYAMRWACIAVALWPSQVVSSQRGTVAITIDDLPFAGGTVVDADKRKQAAQIDAVNHKLLVELSFARTEPL